MTRARCKPSVIVVFPDPERGAPISRPGALFAAARDVVVIDVGDAIMLYGCVAKHDLTLKAEHGRTTGI
jgi:hypothetical protein